MSMSTAGIVIAIVAYMAVLMYLGFRYSKSNNSIGEYYLGGRKLGPFVVAMSAEASDMSSWLLMGLPGLAYAAGICEAFWTALGLGVGTYLNWLFVAKRLRIYSEKINADTIPDFFEKRFHDKKHILMAVSAIIIVLFFVPYTASGFAACGKLFSSLFGIEYMTAMIISAIIIIGYTAMGGFLAASTTDFIQSIIMSVALISVICYGISNCGGVSEVSSYAKSLDGYISLTDVFNAETNAASSYGGVIAIISTLAWGLGYFGMPHILLRFMAIEDPKKLTLSRRISTVWVFIAMGIAIFIGVVSRCLMNVGAISPLEDPERAVIIIAQKISEISGFGIIPALLAGIILAGILACTMSTCDSQLLAASSSVSENLIHQTFGVKLTAKQEIVLARITLLVIAIIGVIFARDPNSSVFQIVSFAWAGFGGAFGPVMILALFWKRCNWQGALAGMISGGVVVIVWHYAVKPLGGVFSIYELLPAFIIGLVIAVLVSLATPEPEKTVLEEYDNAISAL